jgi:glycosyltransferase involved in cell wall biosynthesis
MKNRKKIILVDVFFLYVAQTGIKTYIESTCNQIMSYPGEDFKFVILPGFDRIRRSKFFKGKTHKLINWLYQGLYFFNKLVWLPVCSFWYRADLVFSPDILSPIWCRGKKVSVIHDAFFWESPAHYHPLWRKIYLYLLNLSLEHVLTVSHYAKSSILRYIDSKYQVDVVYSGVDYPKDEAISIKHPPVSRPYFLHVGVMEKRKNLVALVEAFHIFLNETEIDMVLVLVGQRGPRQSLDDYDQVMAAVKKYNLQKKVQLPGYLSAEQLKAYYQHAFAYVFPSLNEGFGLPVLEAFSYQLPVLVSRQGALMEIGGEAVLVCENSFPEGIAKGLIKIALDSTLREELSSAGYDRLSNFSEKKFFLSLQDYFKKVLDE